MERRPEIDRFVVSSELLHRINDPINLTVMARYLSE
jgi:hypothetical protein